MKLARPPWLGRVTPRHARMASSTPAQPPATLGVAGLLGRQGAQTPFVVLLKIGPRLSRRPSNGPSSNGSFPVLIVGVQSDAFRETEKMRRNMSYVFAFTLPGLSLLLLQHGCDAGNERIGLLNEMVSNIDRNAARSTLG